MVALAGSSHMALENDAGMCVSEEHEGAASGMFSSTACASVLAMCLRTVASAIFTRSSGTSCYDNATYASFFLSYLFCVL
jgi:hypothetical protein